MAQKELTPKQQAFIDEYLIDFNASAAAVMASRWKP
jgi:phage terminase small subunit